MSRNTEAEIQAAIVEWVRTVAPQVVIFAVPNGGLRSKSEAARLKWTGVLAGVPDLCLVLPGGRSAFWEVKAPGGRISPAQDAMFFRLGRMGAPVATMRSIEDARAELERLGVATREA